MITYPVPMVPGPVRVPAQVLEAYQVNYGSGDLEPDFLDLYNLAENNLRRLLCTQNRVVIQSGEGMLALWSALKSCLVPGDRVLSLSTGLFGSGIAGMAASLGAQVKLFEFGADQTFSDWAAIEQAIAEFKPKMITAVQCETPSGTLNPLERLASLKQQYGVPLLYIDAVSSLGGAPLLTDDWRIDLLLGGSQKVLSAPPGMAFVAVSPTAWDVVAQVNYSGYDALLPFKDAQEQFYFPYTPYWHGLAALNRAVELLLAEGRQNVYARHEQVAAVCREQLLSMGLSLFPSPTALPSPTVTAVYVPDGLPWTLFDQGLRSRGLVVGGNYGPLATKVFRLGHMGTQADLSLLRQALDIIRDTLRSASPS